MKLAFIGGRDIHILGGIENYMYNLATELTKMGHECVVYCESNRNEIEYLNGFKVIHWKSPKRASVCKILLGHKSSWHCVRQEGKVDMILYNGWPPAMGSWLAAICGRNTVLLEHGLGWKRTKFKPWQRKLIKIIEKWSVKLHRNLLMCSEEQTQYYWEVAHRKCTTLQTAVNLPEENVKNDSDILDRFGLKAKKYFLYMGRLVEEKNTAYLIRGFIKSGIRDFKLVIAGKDDDGTDYMNLIHGLAEGHDNVVFTGAVYGQDKDKLLRNAYTFCLPSTIEGLSIVLIEAMSYKLPVIASDIVANHELLADNALWVKPEEDDELSNAYNQAVNEPDQIKQFIDPNYATVLRNHTWSIVAKKYIEFLKGIGIN